MRVLTPSTAAEAARMKSSEPASVLAAGTTDLMPRWHAGMTPPRCLILLGGIDELRLIRPAGGAMEIGALASHADIASDTRIVEHLPALSAAASSIGAPAVRNMGTIGGNIANASPAADLPPPLIAYGATVSLLGASGARTVPLDRFYTGYLQTDLRDDELIGSITVPLPAPGSVSGFEKLGTRRAQSIAKVSLSGCARCTTVIDGIRLAAGSMAEIPRRLVEVERVLEGRRPDASLIADAVSAASAALRPIDDVRSTASYRSHALGVLLTRLLTTIMERCT